MPVLLLLLLLLLEYQSFSHQYDSQWTKPLGESGFNAGCAVLKVDALPVGHQGSETDEQALAVIMMTLKEAVLDMTINPLHHRLI